MPTSKKINQKHSNSLPDFHIDDRFLQDHLRDVRVEMSWRRELEFRLLQLLLVFYSIIGTVMVQLFTSDVVNVAAFRFTAVVLALLILGVSYFVISRKLLMIWKNC